MAPGPNPEAQGQSQRAQHREPTAGMALRTLETPACVPEQMPYAVEEVIPEGERPTDEEQQTDGACEYRRRRGVASRTSRQGHQPVAKRDQTDRQRRSGESV